MTPNDFSRNAPEPARYPGISGINKLPPPPNLFSGAWANLIGVIRTIVAEAILVTIVVLARIKSVVWVVYFDIGFDSPVLMGLQRPSLGPRTELSGSLDLFAWYGPYAAQDVNRIATAIVTKTRYVG